jgi:NAD(P)-dependent dehydrogenase (short-subunit alcohol dehydrogenase family)
MESVADAASNDVALISGVGPGTGTSLVRRFAAGGYRVAMLARTAERLRALESEFPAARGFVCDVADESAVAAAHDAVRAELGPPSVLVYNAVAGAFGSFLDLEPAVLERNLRINVMGLLYLAKLVAPAMIEAGRGAIIATGNTSALRGRPDFAMFAPSKAAQRILAESMARQLGPQGVHVAYLVIDAVIDVPWTRQRWPDRADDFFIRPAAIAEEVWHLVHQDRSAWSFLTELRPFCERW